MANSMNFVDEVYNSLKTKSFEKYSTQNILKNKKQLAKVLDVEDGYIENILNNAGTYLNIPLKDDYFMNIINVGSDGNCGLYAALVGLYLKDKNTYNSFITGKKNRGNTPHMYVRKEIVRLLQENNNKHKKKVIKTISKNKEWIGNAELLDKLPKIFFGAPIKILSLEVVGQAKNALSFRIFIQDNSLKEEDIIILNTRGHYKLIKIRKGCYTGNGLPVCNSSNDNGGGGRKNNGKSNNSSSKLNKNTVNRHRSTSGTNSPLNRFRGNNASTGRRSNANGNATTVRRNTNGNVNGNATTVRRNTNGNATTVKTGNNANTVSTNNSNSSSVNNNNNNNNIINRGLPCIICGGSQFVYVSKVGKRKLRYTKTGRKYVISNGKRKYLK